ncbi:MAG: hypothetical protein V2A79_04555 [Planctomycetota bacterium]
MATLTKKKLEAVLKQHLALASPTFVIEKLPNGKWSGSIVSDTFQGMEPSERQERIWDVLNAEFGEDCTRWVGTLLPYTQAEWNIDLEGALSKQARTKLNR